MVKILSILIAYIAALVLLIVFKCWITLGIIYGIGLICLIISFMTAKECPPELEDLFEH